MPDDKEISKKVAQILKILARKIEDNPDLLKDTGLGIDDIPGLKRKGKTKEPIMIDFDIFQIFADGGDEALRQKLGLLELRDLKRIVSQHGFNPSKLADKWKNKDRLVNLIIKRVTARSDKGKVFKEYS